VLLVFTRERRYGPRNGLVKASIERAEIIRADRRVSFDRQSVIV
jgi:hypothetical protein